MSQNSTKTGPRAAGTGKYALLVAAGILLSRLFGLIRLRVFAYYFGNSYAKDAFDAAFRIPNLLQNLFGEGALSASFIPVYAKLLANGDEEEAGRVAGAIVSLLALLVSVLVLVGVLGAPLLVDFITPGFTGARRDLALQLVRVLFPGAGLLVLSAWCLGVLNSHKRFFLSYVSPVLWNVAIIAALLLLGAKSADETQLGRLALLAAWGSVAGSAIQFGVQLPTVLRLARHLRLNLDLAATSVSTVIKNFVPAFISRGVVQISAFVDQTIASWLPIGAVSALNYGQTIYLLPVSLFGMSVSAVELTAMSSATGSEEEIKTQLRQRLNAGMQQIAFFIVPSVIAFLALGDVIVGALLQNGRFSPADTRYVWTILAGSTVGLLASTLGRINSSTFYALQDTRTPLFFALARVTLGIIMGYASALYLPAWLGLEAKWGAAFLTATSGLAGWIEFALLRRALKKRIGPTSLPFAYTAKLWLAAVCGAGCAWSVKAGLGERHPILLAVFVLGVYGGVYFALTAVLGIPQAARLAGKLSRRKSR